MLYKNRERFGGLSLRLGRAASRIGLAPNHWTLISLLPALGVFYFLYAQNFALAAAMFFLAAALDFVDGSVARATGKTTKFGAYLDTVVDRYVEGIVVIGLLFAGLPGLVVGAEAWIVAYLFGSMMTTYSKAAAKEKGLVEEELKGGILERAERLGLLFLGIVLAVFNPLYLTAVVALLALLSNISALQRITAAARRGERD